MNNYILWSVRLDIQDGHIKTNQQLNQQQIETMQPYWCIMENSAFSRLKMVYSDYIINIRKYPYGEYPITFELWQKSK